MITLNQSHARIIDRVFEHEKDDDRFYLMMIKFDFRERVIMKSDEKCVSNVEYIVAQCTHSHTNSNGYNWVVC